MDNIDKKFVKRSFNKSAYTYDRYAGLQKDTVQELLRLINPKDYRVRRALDIGTGTGNLTAGLMQRFPQTEIFGCDLALAMLAQAEKKTGGHGRFSAADAEFLPYKNNAFDLVVTSFTFQWLDSLQKAFFEVKRVLTPGGTFSFSFFGTETFHELRSAYKAACRETGYGGGKALDLSLTERSVGGALSACGFCAPTLRSYRVVEKYDSVREVMTLIRGMGAKNASTRRNRSLGVRKIWQRLIHIYKREFSTNGRIPATFEIIAGSAKTPGSR